jgi:hypothetical protein
METIVPVAVRQIFEENNGFARVSVNTELFKALSGFIPALPYKTARSANGKGIRAYNVGGTPVFTQYDGETKKTSIIMSTEDAKKHLKTVEQERAEGEQVAFAF